MQCIYHSGNVNATEMLTRNCAHWLKETKGPLHEAADRGTHILKFEEKKSHIFVFHIGLTSSA